MKRNIIQEIEMKRVRYNHNESYALIQQLKDYKSNLENDMLKNNFDYQSSYFIPVVICSAFESFFRSAIRDIIDLKRINYKRTMDITEIKNFRFDISLWKEVQDKEISIGELVSHLIKIRKVEGINALFSDLLGSSFLNELKSFSYRTKATRLGETEKYWSINYNQVLEDIDSAYEVRNILCHEFGFWIEIKKDTLFRYLKHSIVFLEHVDRYLYCLHNPLKKESCKAKEETIAKRNFIAREKELDQVIRKISEATDDLGYDRGPFEDAFANEMILWKQYRKKLAKSNCEMYSGASNFRVMYWSNMDQITHEKINSLFRLNESLFFEAEMHSKVQKFT